ncbi:ferredoxin--NADP+ reductase [Phycisphaerales bacterium]|nr:ferredoxin--NADP+ reductase [Phycisphaerales bacterium]
MHLLTPVKPGVATVVSNERCTASRKSSGFVRHLALDVSGTPLEGAFLSGQSFGVIPPGTDQFGRQHKLRLYSIASPTRGEDGSGKILATTVKRTIDEHWESGKLFLGVASNYLCDLRVGDKVTVTGPNGKRFLLPADPAAHDYLFFATGTGIAPFYGMIRELLGRDTGSRVVFTMGSPYATDLLYHRELTDLAERHANFTYLTALSRERQLDGSPPMYAHDRLARSADIFAPMLESPRTLIYVCGIAGMELGVFQRLAERLSEPARDQYLRVDASARENIANWERRMINKELHPTRRVFLEVY